ncbi:RND family transporter [Nocardioides marmoriginsengisoli]|uniref:RND family transporter n=1 Tax=Nocardioides marmoriginsengisoli TaxID=661483 RepID=A0A3N0CPN6_9ACTN|nr:MMPL family transporter [Nocardioides marmoriginsengisoli]RNL65432.1 RND family transporter [Nocardioides marmoriginsengisoli]
MNPEGAESATLARLARFAIRRAPLMIGGWLLVVLAVNVLVPQLETVVAKDSTPFVPESAPSLRAVKDMDTTFGNGKSRSFIVLVAARDGGLTKADDTYLTNLADRLRKDTEHVTYVQDITDPTLRSALTSADGEASYFQIGLAGYTGAPTSVGQVEAVRDDAKVGRPEGLDVKVTGASATITDMVVEVENSIVKITAVTLVLIAIILMVIYRSVVITAFVLSVIGIALAAARGVVSFLGVHDIFDVSTFTGSFLTAIVLGATTDYAIFLISRFHEQRRRGVEPREAARVASSRVSAVIIGSALTVILANACLALAHVGLFRTTGPAIAVSVALALGISLTLTPPLVAILGARGWLEPRPRPGSDRGWMQWGNRVVARPGMALAAGLVPLVLLAAFFPVFKPSYDERRVQPDDTESNDGYALMDAHYPVNEALPDFVLVTADHDLRNSRDLAALEQAAASVARVPGVGSVRAVTRPTGTTITEASVGYQAGVVGTRLSEASGKLRDGKQDTTRLVDGAGQLADGAGELAAGAGRAANGAGRVLAGVKSLHTGLERLAHGSRDAVAGSARLRAGASALADGLDTAVEQTQVAVDGLGLAYQALRKSLTCGLDPYCKGAREGIRQVYVGERDQLIPGLREAAAGARQLADGTTDLESGLKRIRGGLATAEAGSAKLRDGQQSLAAGLDDLAAGTSKVADAGSQVAGGTKKLTGSMDELQAGLATAAAYLTSTAQATKTADGGFYLPPSALKDQRFALASGAYLSADGKVARLIVLGTTNAFGHEAASRSRQIAAAANDGLRGTELAGSKVAITGMAATNADITELSSSDFRLVAIVALIAVFLVLLLLIRSIVAASFLLASVVLSYAATMGLAVLVWQLLLGDPLEWTVACIAFVLLVAVGADYNLLLIKRMHEEAPDGSREGIARAVGLTGGVITAAGVIFASSLFAMMSGSVTTLVQLGFTVGLGLLIDTFVVRTLVVPAFAALVGPRLWWPSRVSTPLS